MGEGRIRRWLFLGLWLAAAALYLALFVPHAVLFDLAWLDKVWWAKPGRGEDLVRFVSFLAGIGGVLYTADYFLGKGVRSADNGAAAGSRHGSAPRDPAPATPAATDAAPPAPDHADTALPAATSDGRGVLHVHLRLGSGGLHRSFRVGNTPLPGPPASAPPDDLNKLRAQAQLASPHGEQALGRDLYRLLFCDQDGDHFPALAHTAWDAPVNAVASQSAVSVVLHWMPHRGAADGDAWPLALPWNLARDADGALLAEHGWLFEAEPPGVRAERTQVLVLPPPVLLLCGRGLDGAAAHAVALQQQIDRELDYKLPTLNTDELDRVAGLVQQNPAPEVLYVHAGADEVDLGRLAETLGDALPLILLNLIGDQLPQVPPALVQHRKLILCGHPAKEAEQARRAGRRWLLGLFTAVGPACPLSAAVSSFGPRVRLWSGATLGRDIGALRGKGFDRNLVRLLLDRLHTRNAVASHVNGALGAGRGVLALVAAGTASNRPELLPNQIWYHYSKFGDPAGRRLPERFPLSLAANPGRDAFLLRFTDALRQGGRRDHWMQAVDRHVGELAPEEQCILSLEWQVPARPLDADAHAGENPQEALARWRSEWLEAWLDFGLHLTDYRRLGVLIVNMLIVQVPDPEPAPPKAATTGLGDKAAKEAEAWCNEALERWYRRMPGLEAEQHDRFLLLGQTPLSTVPEADLQEFFTVHYPLAKHYRDLPVQWLAHWIVTQTDGGDFQKTVALVESLHDNTFAEARDALADARRTG
jgi:hypothetical protein